MSVDNKYLIRYNPITSSMRHVCLLNKRNLSDNYKLNNLFLSISQNSGRNNSGKITVRHRGAGNKKIYRKIDFSRYILNIPGYIYTIEYDPYRSSFISLVSFLNGIYCYILSTQFDMKNRLFIYNHDSKVSYYNVGDSNFLLFFTNGSLIHNIESIPGRGGHFSRSAGTYSLLINGDVNFTKIKISSGTIIQLSSYCRASLGKVSNSLYRDINLGKAGRSRWLGIRPKVRGVAMNPIDHPHGGGEGKKTGRASPYTVWGRMQKTKS
jgi:large subunit ribosomal protein L2